MKKAAVVLSGCGFKDGTAITEAVSVFIALSQEGVHYGVFAPDASFVSMDHINDKEGESRNVLVEAARLSRGEISPLEDLKVGDWDALVLPGGYGAALQLSSWAKEGASCRMNASLERIIKEFYQAQKPIAAICISPVLLAKALGGKKITVTIGSEASTAEEIQKTGALHENCEVTDYVTDRENRVITTPAYMCAAKPHEVFEGISKAMKELAALC